MARCFSPRPVVARLDPHVLREHRQYLPFEISKKERTRYYMVLNLAENGKRKQKWISTNLPAKGNK